MIDLKISKKYFSGENGVYYSPKTNSITIINGKELDKFINIAIGKEEGIYKYKVESSHVALRDKVYLKKMPDYIIKVGEL